MYNNIKIDKYYSKLPYPCFIYIGNGNFYTGKPYVCYASYGVLMNIKKLYLQKERTLK